MALFGLLPSGVSEAGSMGLDLARGPAAATGKGLFGVSGTFRDVLGTLGDALLIGNGMNPIYHPALEQEKLSRATMGYGIDPQGAINRAMAVNPAYGEKLAEQYMSRQDTLAKRKSEAEKAAEQARKDSLSNEEKVTDLVASVLSDSTPETWGARVKVAQQIAKKYGANLPIPLGDARDQNVVDQYRSLALGLKDKETLDRQRDSEDRAERTFQTNTQLGIGRMNVSAAGQAGRLRVAGAKASAPPAAKKGGIARPAAVSKPSKPFIFQNGKILTRQPDGSYK